MKEQTTFKRLLKERNMTVRQFAEKAGLNKHSLDVYVSGRIQGGNDHIRRITRWVSISAVIFIGSLAMNHLMRKK